ncbi:ribbon-helix-helix protein, CopG family [Fusobacterium necrophorum]|mgnify:CR=1 FL=1|uniref:ribbon-helix-helix protein, CopG family n=1 Tax=Fusobacterium necrophorum TaxID=859 RepID=UPI002432D628|nr:ribbon-helix-helix protein, CopG family [Fusobacterium necrophorum]MCF0163238.1 ribbon-helix-helix protein, CopG family [Fusobacterium necrophorum]MCI7344338.1 ribbon-helix-helix protein, CopG family [Fusobacterium necrophorum]MDK4495478.1 ribbon-helix-helix protein, CopG family [Fusobacterium necrophorum]MDK4510326.1 ribbon-helix-helix protein, CopG family [Fusobacterium necrophorum]
MEEKKSKMGRPTDSKKNLMLRIRLDEETYKKLEKLSKIENVSMSEFVRNFIKVQYKKKFK